MTGKYQILMGNDLKNIEIVNNKFYYKMNRIMGACLLTIIPPKFLKLPFLMYRRKQDKKTYNTLCSLCCETESLSCKHSDEQRAITSSYMLSEIEYALSLNYKIISIHEMHIYTESKFIFQDFIQKLNFFKTKNSDCFSECKSVEEKVAHCAKLNSFTQLDNRFLLTPQNIKVNNAKRNFYKLASNALFGKLQQKSNHTKIVYASTSKEIEDIFFSDSKIKNIYCLNDQLCQLEIETNELKLPPNLTSNCYLGAQICSYAREVIHKDAMTVLNLNYQLFQINCDSLMFSMPTSDKNPFNMSNAMLGSFKFVLQEEILSYYSLGAKSYCITYKDRKQIKTNSKICGLQLNGNAGEPIINDKLFDDYLKQYFDKRSLKLNIAQQRHLKEFKKLKITTKVTNVSFSNQVSTRRLVQVNDIYETFPYGYSNV